MADDGNKTLTPKLRFPEFRDEPGWRVAPLDALATFSSGGTPSKDNPDYWNGDIPWISASSMYDTDLRDSEHKVTRKAIGNGTRIARAGSLLILTRGSMLYNRVPMGIASVDVAFNQDVRALTLDPSLHGHFLLKQLMAREAEITVNETGIGAGKIDTDHLRKFPVAVPEPAEQQKIADCLTSLDELIAAQGRKVEALRVHKKGLMQQLFPRQGETLPRLRFPEFRDAGEWASKPFEEFVVRSFYGTSSSTSVKGRYPVLRMGNMVDGRLDFSNLVYLDLDEESFEGIRLTRGDILLNRTNSLDLVGKISMFDHDIECITASYIVTYRLDTARIDPTFCNSMLNTPQYQAKIKALARPSVSQANINPTTFKKELIVSVPLPAEQQRIADCLSTLDARLTAESRKLDALKLHKRGLMQQLFPSPEE